MVHFLYLCYVIVTSKRKSKQQNRYIGFSKPFEVSYLPDLFICIQTGYIYDNGQQDGICWGQAQVEPRQTHWKYE